MNNIKVITSNIKKSEDFIKYGFEVEEFQSEIIEVLSEHVSEVALYKSRDTNINNSIVEDTSLEVEGSHFLGTEIKHIYDEISNNIAYHDNQATWKVALCYKNDDVYYISEESLKGFLKYPALEAGYHFNRIFAIDYNGSREHLEILPKEIKEDLNPRYKAIKKLVNAINSGDYSQLIKVNQAEMKNWEGNYQVEKIKKKLTF